MKSSRIATLALASIFLLGSCDAILGFNLFEGMVQAGVVGNIEKAETADDYMAESDADNFIEALEETDKVEEAVAALEEVYDPDGDPETPPPGDPAEAQEAAAVAAEIMIYTTPAGEVVDNIIEVIAGDPAALNVDDPATLVAAIIPPAISGDPVAFEETILGFLDAWEAYAALGASITGGELATDEVQAGDLIIAAAIGAALDALMDQFYPYDGTLVTEEDARASLAADLIKLFDGDTSNDPTYLMTDPTLVGGFLYAGDPDALPDPIPPAPLYNILLAAGFDVAALMGGS